MLSQIQRTLPTNLMSSILSINFNQYFFLLLSWTSFSKNTLMNCWLSIALNFILALSTESSCLSVKLLCIHRSLLIGSPIRSIVCVFISFYFDQFIVINLIINLFTYKFSHKSLTSFFYINFAHQLFHIDILFIVILLDLTIGFLLISF